MSSETSELLMPIVRSDDDGLRGSTPGVCFYCNQPIGESHSRDCVAIHKKVLVEFTFQYEVEVPYSWTPEDIEFHRNYSSWCASNAIREIDNLNESEGCLCGLASTRFLKITEPGPYAKSSDAGDSSATITDVDLSSL